MQRMLTAALVAAAVGCGGDTSEPGGGFAASLAGTWALRVLPGRAGCPPEVVVHFTVPREGFGRERVPDYAGYTTRATFESAWWRPDSAGVRHPLSGSVELAGLRTLSVSLRRADRSGGAGFSGFPNQNDTRFGGHTGDYEGVLTGSRACAGFYTAAAERVGAAGAP